MTAILKEDPPDLPIADRRIPPALARIVDRCLDKNPAARFQSAGDMAFALEALSAHSGATEALTESPVVLAKRLRLVWILVGALGVSFLALLSAAVFGLFGRSPANDPRTFRFSIAPPEGWTLAVGAIQPTGVAVSPIAVSPNGWQVALVAQDREGERLIWIHSRDALAARPLTGTENASSPFWSPDGRFLAFFANGKLKEDRYFRRPRSDIVRR